MSPSSPGPYEAPDDPELVMPFVVFSDDSEGNEAHAFALGWECGILDRMLGEASTIGFVTIGRYVHTAILDQLDLIAMQHGLIMTSEPYEEDDHWSWALFTNKI